MHGFVQRPTTKPADFAEMAIAETLAAICDVLVKRIWERVMMLELAPPCGKKQTRLLHVTKIKKLKAAVNMAVDAGDTVEHFIGFLRPLISRDYHDDETVASMLHQSARDVRPLLDRLRSLERLTLAYPDEVIRRSIKIRDAARVL